MTQPHLKSDNIYITEDEIASIVSRLADELTRAYAGHNNLVAVVLLEGARRFATDLFALMKDPFEAAFIRARSYNGTESSGNIDIQGSIDELIAGKDLLLIDDIYDTGLTLKNLTAYLRERGAYDIKTCVLLEKDIAHPHPIPIDFLGRKIEDRFVVGYGMDHNEQHRELPYIAFVD